MKKLLVLLAACGGSNDTPLKIDVAAPRPAPGLDLSGPIPLPDRSAPSHRAPGAVLDLAADRTILAVDVPKPPHGGSVGFEFADDRAGWVAHMPEGLQLPAVAYGDGRIYASGGFESVSFYGLEAKTGRIEWATTNLEDNGPTAPVYEDDRVIFNTESCTLFALDAKTGRRLWLRKLGDPTVAQTAVAGGLVYASHPEAGTGQELTAYRVKDGEPVWTHAIDAELLAAPIVSGDFVYASTIGGTTYRFARATGRLLWARALDATTAPWIDGDELYVARHKKDKEQQAVYDTKTGKLKREQDLSHGSYASDVPVSGYPEWKEIWQFEGSRPVVDRGIRYVAMGGEILASDAQTGELIWKRRYAHKEDQRALGSVALAGSAIVVATREGQLYGLDVDTGYTLWSYAIGHRVRAEPIVAQGWIYAATEDGYVVALNVADPTLDGWHMFGGNPAHDGPVASATTPKRSRELAGSPP